MVIGVTGGIGAGKSTVVSFIIEVNRGIIDVAVIDVDRMGWNVLEQKKDELVEAFGSSIIDVDRDKVDRKKLSTLVFGNRNKMRLLESIVHPPLLFELKKQIESFRTSIIEVNRKVLIVDCALVYEWQIESWFDKVILVKANYETKLARLLKMGYTRKEADIRIKSQLLDNVRTRHGVSLPIVIENNGSLETLCKETKKVWSKIVVSVK
ncbi:MAG: dephospho-CoA kinase [bacterium]|nr:dephospho-CoA kinase [bacterium]